MSNRFGDPEKMNWGWVNRISGAHVRIYRLSRGKLGGRVSRKAHVLLLNHVGRKSGKARTTPLIYLRDGNDIILVASKGGFSKDPAWWLNIRDAGEATVEVGSKKIPVAVRQATAEEKARIWPQLVEIWSDYAKYQETTDREIPLAVLTPKG